jgi:hypothetical protein
MQSKSSSKPKQAAIDYSTASGAQIRSLIRKNLVANPDFPRLYAEVLESEGYNYNQAKDLAIELQKKLGVYKPQTHVQTCSHIMVTGVRCQSPALRGEQFCYFHQRMLKGVSLPRKRLNHIALLESEEAIQVSVMELVNGLMTGSIDLKRGELVLRALNTAVRNARRVRFFNISADKMVTEVPHYEEEDEARDRARDEVRDEIHRVRTEAAQQAAEKAEAEKATLEKPKQQPSAAPAATPQKSQAQTAEVTKPKPPLGVKAAPPASDRKVAVRAGS